MAPTAEEGVNLITGATGLLGSHIAEQLRQCGRCVRALVRPGSDTAFLRSIGAELAIGDVTDRHSLDLACRGVTTVYHAAARVGDWGAWDEFERVTIAGTGNLIEAAAAAGVERFVHISSISAYGHVDGDDLVLDETAPLGRKLYRWAYYSRAKVAAEMLVREAHQTGRIKATVIRPSWLYGPRDRASMGRLIASIRARKIKLLGKGDNRLNVAHAANVAEAAILAADSERAMGEAYNCSSDGVLTQKKYFDLIAEALGEPPIERRVPYQVARWAGFALECVGHLFKLAEPPLVTRYSAWLIGRRCFFETRKVREHLGWSPRISYEQGIPEAVRHYLREHEAAGHRPPVTEGTPESAHV
ncbi:MAG: NAD-dependent epimerase/dehydratase family protein [Phycisphaerales bacterium]|nr:MAG: NAD-dependent epimerase/dehydratase family protein [Phycisphaerales bacterium]